MNKTTNSQIRFISIIKLFWTGCLNIFYPAVCVVCKKPVETSWWICPTCLKDIEERQTVDSCPRCSAAIPQYFQFDEFCPSCQNLDAKFSQTTSAGQYAGVLRELALGLKYGRRVVLAFPLAQLMVDKLQKLNWQNEVDVIVPVPLHPASEHKRTFNQAELIADEIGARLKIPVAKNVLLKIRATEPQARFRREQRITNIKGAFALHSEKRAERFLKDKTVLLVDDVMTTGATAAECARVIKRAGPKEIRVIVAARTTFIPAIVSAETKEKHSGALV